MAGNLDRATVGLMHSGQNIHESGFPGTIFSNQRVHFAGPNVKINASQYVVAVEALPDSPHDQEWLPGEVIPLELVAHR
jgi:hypothetical protein